MVAGLLSEIAARLPLAMQPLLQSFTIQIVPESKLAAAKMASTRLTVWSTWVYVSPLDNKLCKNPALLQIYKSGRFTRTFRRASSRLLSLRLQASTPKTR
jgi:hypothetical protein